DRGPGFRAEPSRRGSPRRDPAGPARRLRRGGRGSGGDHGDGAGDQPR
ncbi:MAG: hypothetical protein AVDCRST_MAG04-1910, partial [uncultured Acetobacteraceae bacterium]